MVAALSVLYHSMVYGYAQESLKAPQVTVSATTKSSITVKWNKVKGADYYRVFKSADKKKWSQSSKLYKVSYKSSNLKSATRYYYKVCAYDVKNGKIVEKETSKIIKGATRLLPGNISSIKRSGSKIYVSWGGFPKAKGYKVYVSSDGGYTFRLKYSGQSTKYTLKNVSSKKTYYFKVKSTGTVGGVNTTSKFCSRKRSMATSGNNFSKLKLDKPRFIKNLKRHENDKYYLTTPYVYLTHTYSEANMMRANGVKSSKAKGMNCAGFIARAMVDAGGNVDAVSKMGSKGGAGNAYNWTRFVEVYGLKKYSYRSVSSLLKSGRARKGDIIIRIPDSYSEDPIRDYHTAIFWGSKSSQNRVWHSTMEYGTANNKISVLPERKYGCTYYLVKLSK